MWVALQRDTSQLDLCIMTLEIAEVTSVVCFFCNLYPPKEELWGRRRGYKKMKSELQYALSKEGDHPFKTSANFRDFWPLPSFSRQLSTFHQNVHPLKKKRMLAFGKFCPFPIIYRNNTTFWFRFLKLLISEIAYFFQYKKINFLMDHIVFSNDTN